MIAKNRRTLSAAIGIGKPLENLRCEIGNYNIGPGSFHGHQRFVYDRFQIQRALFAKIRSAIKNEKNPKNNVKK
jgi:hypothetical protein